MAAQSSVTRNHAVRCWNGTWQVTETTLTHGVRSWPYPDRFDPIKDTAVTAEIINRSSLHQPIKRTPTNRTHRSDHHLWTPPLSFSSLRWAAVNSVRTKRRVVSGPFRSGSSHGQTTSTPKQVEETASLCWSKRFSSQRLTGGPGPMEALRSVSGW